MMILANVNIGTGPSAGNGDPLRTAFGTINNNFQIITNNVNSLTNSVTSVAGRTGNITLTVNDIVGYSSSGRVVNRYTSTADSTITGATVIDASSTVVFLAPTSGQRASYQIGNGIVDGQTITFVPSFRSGTNQFDVQNIWVLSNRLYDFSNGVYSGGVNYYPWYPFQWLNSVNYQVASTLTWDNTNKVWIPNPYYYD